MKKALTRFWKSKRSQEKPVLSSRLKTATIKISIIKEKN
jgi:hypothetical protein